MNALPIPVLGTCLALAGLPGCGDKPGDTAAPEGDVDTDSDSDADTDADADADADTDTAPPNDGGLDLDELPVRIAGTAEDWHVGRRVEAVGDPDGDGAADFAIAGVKQVDWFFRQVRVFPGGTGWRHLDATSVADAGLTLSSTAGEDDFGDAVAGVGDLDQDGFDELLVGAPEAAGGGAGSGAAYLVFGRTDLYDAGTLGPEEAEIVLWGEDEGDRAGIAVAGAGDVNADGWPDLLVGATSRRDARGAAYLYTGPLTASSSLAEATATIDGSSVNGHYSCADQVGSNFAAGDIDGDGYDDILVGTSDEGRGIPYLFHGPLSGALSLGDAEAWFNSPSEYSSTSAGMAIPGDMNGDGSNDIVLGTPCGTMGACTGVLYNWPGEIYVLPDGLEGRVNACEEAVACLYPTSVWTWGGWELAAPGDVDQDGHQDLWVGVYGYPDLDAMTGAAYLLYGPFSGSAGLDEVPHLRFDGPHEGAEAGFTVAAPGDVDLDGVPDLLVASPGFTEDAEEQGATWLLMPGSSF